MMSGAEVKKRVDVIVPALGGPKRLEGPPLRGVVAAAALTAIILGAADQRPAQALEMPPETTWAVGIQRIRSAVINEKAERSVSYIEFKDGSFAWPQIVLSDDPEATHFDAGDELRNVLESGKRGGIEIRCQLHTHPIDVFEGSPGKAITVPFNPPSDIDVSAENARSSAALRDTYARAGLPIMHEEFAAADASGLWYYTRTTGEKITSKDKEEVGRAYMRFLAKSLYYKDFRFEAAFPDLQKAYLVHYKARIRFVSYSQIDQEPTCAGVDYEMPSTASRAGTRSESVPLRRP